MPVSAAGLPMEVMPVQRRAGSGNGLGVPLRRMDGGGTDESIAWGRSLGTTRCKMIPQSSIAWELQSTCQRCSGSLFITRVLSLLATWVFTRVSRRFEWDLSRAAHLCVPPDCLLCRALTERCVWHWCLCAVCGKDSVKRDATGIWKCKGCRKVVAGGAYVMNTPAAATVRSAIRRLREVQEA